GPNHAAFFDWNFVALAGPVVDFAETVLCHRPSTRKFYARAVGSASVNIYAVVPESSLRQSRALEHTRASHFAPRRMPHSERVLSLGRVLFAKKARRSRSPKCGVTRRCE